MDNKDSRCPTCHRPNTNMDFLDTIETHILVTGGYGFIGSSFINYIMDNYHNILLTNIDAMYYCANENSVNIRHRNSPRYKFVKANITDRPMLQYLINDIKPTHVVHFAAQSHVDGSFKDSLQYTCDNVLGTHTLMDCLLEYQRTQKQKQQQCQESIGKIISLDNSIGLIKKIIHVSTDEVYGDSMLSMEEKGKHEQSILCPTNPYAATKAGAELIASSYYHSMQLPIIITRSNNVYGPNQYPEKLIPRFISLLKQQQPVTIAGTGQQLRTFLHTSDICHAFECILQRGVLGEIYNIGSSDEYSVLDVANILIDLMYDVPSCDASYRQKLFAKKLVTYIEDRPYNDQRYHIHDNKIRELGWNPTIKFTDGLKQLISSTNIHINNDMPWLYTISLLCDSGQENEDADDLD